MPASGSGRHIGLVRTTVGGTYEVELHQGVVVEAVLRGRLKTEQRSGDAVVPGDRVEVERQADGGYTIEEVHDRRTELARRAPGPGRKRAKVLVANVETMFIVFATAHPAPRLRMLDRFLVQAEAAELEPVIVVNKIDLADPAALAPFELYRELGYAVLETSVETGAGLAPFRERLCGRTSALTGPSGVGKSSLLNAVQPGLQLRTGEVSEAARKGRKGRHTTVSARLIPLDCGGHVADTPGLRELGLWGVEPRELALCFPDFRPYLDACRFRGSCTHVHEPGCGVLEAVAAGEIAQERLASYQAIAGGGEA